MRRNQLELLILCAALGVTGGLIGGVVASHPTLRVWSSASAATPTNQVVSANEFDLKGPNGKLGAKLFMDRGTDPTLYLYDSEGKEAVILRVSPATAGLTLHSGHARIELQTFMTGADMMFFDREGLDADRVALIFSDSWTGFTLLGSDHNTASHTFISSLGAQTSFYDNNGRDMVTLGVDDRTMYPSHSYIDIYNTKGKTRAELDDTLSLYDDAGKLRSVVGSTTLKNTKTGSTTELSPSSIVLFGENGHVLWQAP